MTEWFRMTIRVVQDDNLVVTIFSLLSELGDFNSEMKITIN